MKTEEKLNMTMLCDFYELTMGNGYFESGYKDHITYFDVFFLIFIITLTKQFLKRIVVQGIRK